MPVGLTIQLRGDDEARKSLIKLEKDIPNNDVPFQRTIIYLQGRFGRTFRKGGEPRWKPLAEVTQMLRRGTGGSKPLRDRGTLQASLTGKTTHSIQRVRKTQLQFGTNVFYAPIHDRGKTIKVTPRMRGWFGAQGIHLSPATTNINIPRRRFMHFVPEDSRKIEKIFKDYYNEVTKKVST